MRAKGADTHHFLSAWGGRGHTPPRQVRDRGHKHTNAHNKQCLGQYNAAPRSMSKRKPGRQRQRGWPIGGASGRGCRQALVLGVAEGVGMGAPKRPKNASVLHTPPLHHTSLWHHQPGPRMTNAILVNILRSRRAPRTPHECRGEPTEGEAHTGRPVHTPLGQPSAISRTCQWGEKGRVLFPLLTIIFRSYTSGGLWWGVLGCA